MNRMLCLVCASLLVGAAVQAQPASPERDPLTLGLSLGPSVGGGGHIGASVSTQRGRIIGAVRLSANELERRVATSLFGSARDSAGELALLVGYAHPVAGRWQATVSAGVSAVRTYRHQAGPCLDAYIFCIPTDGGREVSPVIAGLPLEVGVRGPVAGAFGVGVRAFTNVNSDEVYGGLSVSFLLNPVRRGGGDH